jgi:hypothetical protein
VQVNGDISYGHYTFFSFIVLVARSGIHKTRLHTKTPDSPLVKDYVQQNTSLGAWRIRAGGQNCAGSWSKAKFVYQFSSDTKGTAQKTVRLTGLALSFRYILDRDAATFRYHHVLRHRWYRHSS